MNLKKHLNSKTLGQLFFIAVVTLPVLSGLVYATLYSLGFVGVLNKGFTTENWEAIFFGSPFWTSILFSFYVAVTSIVLSLVFSLSMALSWKKALQKGALSTAMYLPLCFPGTVMAFFMFQLLSKSGFLSRLGFTAGILSELNQFPALINDAYGIGIIITSVVLITPFFVILFSNMYRSENIANYKQLASTFGATKLQLLTKVTLPILLKKSSVTIYLFVIFVMGSYEIPLLLGRQSPQMISVAILQKIQRFNLYDIPKGFAMSILYVLIIISVLLLLYFRNRDFFKTETNA
ncbi:ABC transporter permease subunit [Subsaximicrobium wynnwilliamsii]|uniref:ABC transporter permease subunit n=1 Tax=Subsaximicrobium wynnwilliamsii TaxID=291179 RepID=A0A5C6ZJJ2_9FLAO|nr:ABC transporter permease subunit [Subsaximicrobium wynnwilliamsii]TXD89300.1 ABC transporter permease subunit [Subsaximicrobium wynnwilliamsii]TXE03239.1 ABC transporter permease subunit [Subsaximicrobium wynnwilliamsii]